MPTGGHIDFFLFIGSTCYLDYEIPHTDYNYGQFDIRGCHIQQPCVVPYGQAT